ncbi:MAG: undecaprenyl-diphosphate phosphatase [Mariprofundales bacterium]
MRRMQEQAIFTTISNFQAIVLGLVQGLTEFLPISSSAHLALAPLLTDWPDQGLAFDCMVHLATLTAVIAYFRSDIVQMISGFSKTLQARSWNVDSQGKLAWFVLLGTIPVGLAGLAFKDIVETDLRSITVIAWASIGFGLLLWWADVYGKRQREEDSWTFGHIILVGISQALALIPGTSRSGATMTAALMLGYSRQAAARFSFLLSIPVIILAAGLKIKDWFESSNNAASLDTLIIGFIVAAISAYICIHYFLKFIEKTGMLPYVIYRVLLGVFLLLLF